MKLRCSLLVLIFSFSVAHAGNKVGNGGDAVVCKAGNQDQVKLLDFYESDFNFVSKINDPYEILNARLEEFKKIAPKLSVYYQKRVKNIANEIQFKSEVRLTDIKDSRHLFKPNSKDCKVEQLAIRKALTTKDEKRFLVDQSLWSKMSVEHQAGLLLHEIVYEHLIKLGVHDSVKARKLNVAIFDEKTTSGQFWSMIHVLEIPIYP